VDDAVLDRLRDFSTPTIANAIEKFRVRPRGAGYTDGSIRCLFPSLGRMVAVAATVTVRSMPARGPVPFDVLLDHAFAQDGPSVIVAQDLDDPPGRGTAWGEVNTGLLGAVGCLGVVTNGAARDLPEVEAAGFRMYAGSVCPSHGQMQIAEVGTEVTVGGLRVSPGDLLHADQHGVVAVPHEIAAQVPDVAAELEAKERRLLDIARSRALTPEELRQALAELA
jgi:regulator of RNase E activity RraA